MSLFRNPLRYHFRDTHQRPGVASFVFISSRAQCNTHSLSHIWLQEMHTACPIAGYMNSTQPVWLLVTAGQSAERGNASHTWNHHGHTHWDHEVHVRPPTNANQTESGACQITVQCCRKCPQPSPRSREKTQRDADWDGASLWRVKHRTQYCKYASWQNSNKQRSGKGTQTVSGVSRRHSCQKTWQSTVENGQMAKQSHSRKQ